MFLNKIWSKFEWLYAGLNYSEGEYTKEQEKRFSKLGLSYSDAQNRLNFLYESNPSLKVEIRSCHHTLFVALSEKYKFNNILEIGTHSGTGAVLLSLLFPDAKITTIDLPDDSPVFSETYGRDDYDERAKFIRKRDKLLNEVSNVEFIKTNSLNLTFLNEMFDLIWVDGAHGYPVVSADIINSLRLVEKGGFVVCDDIYKHTRASDKMYRSIAGYETIRELFDAGIINYSLILKRVVKPWGHPIIRKYIAVLQKKQ